MFDIGFSELLIIVVVALLVLGPERLPRAARMAGLWVRRARAQWYSVQAEFERELANEEFRRSVGKPLEELERSLADEAQQMRRQLQSSVASDAEVDANYAVEPREPEAPPPSDPPPEPPRAP